MRTYSYITEKGTNTMNVLIRVLNIPFGAENEDNPSVLCDVSGGHSSQTLPASPKFHGIISKMCLTTTNKISWHGLYVYIYICTYIYVYIYMTVIRRFHRDFHRTHTHTHTLCCRPWAATS